MFPALTIGSLGVFQVDSALCWRTGLAVDADGSPHAYAPAPLVGLDYLANAGKPGNWWGLVCGPDGNPIVQGDTDPAPGFYVSPTSLVDKTRGIGDPLRYVDAERIPYLVTPPELRIKAGVQLGDVAIVQLGANVSPAIVADVGPHGKIGEGSIALHRALGLSGDAKHGGISHGVGVALFAGSALSPAWPRSIGDIAAQVQQLFQAWGGVGRLAVVV